MGDASECRGTHLIEVLCHDAARSSRSPSPKDRTSNPSEPTEATSPPPRRAHPTPHRPFLALHHSEVQDAAG